MLLVTHCGKICLGKKVISLSRVFAGQPIGIAEVEDKIWLVSFMDFDIGYLDEDAGRAEPLDNPFRSKVLPMSPEYSVTYVSLRTVVAHAFFSEQSLRGALIRSMAPISPTWTSGSSIV